MKTRYAIVALAVLMVILSACKSQTQAPTQNPEPTPTTTLSEATTMPSPEPTEPPMVPDFTLESSDGQEISLSDYEGKVVVLNFWASWCGFCLEEMPDFQKLQDEIEDSEEVVLLMLNQTDGQRETREKADAYLADHDHRFLNLYDPGEVGYGIFGLMGLPATVVIDGEGRLSDYALGLTNYDEVIQMIEGAK